jgi:hypothetical protein
MTICFSSFGSSVILISFLTNCSITTAITYSPATGAERAKVPSISVNAAMSGSGTGPAKNETLAWGTGLPISSLTTPKITLVIYPLFIL